VPWQSDLPGIGPAASIVAPIAAATASHLVIRALLASALARHFADQPNERSLHAAPVPRTGGLGIMAGVAVAAFLGGCDARVLAAALALAALSMLDDWRGLPILVRFAGHFLAAGLVLAHLAPAAPWWLLAVTVVATVWMTNLYNFMDGSDGLAGGMAVFGFGAYAVAAWLAGVTGLALFAAGVAAAAAGFLALNFHPARVFMGDAGSIPLGFLAAALGVAGVTADCWPAWFPVAVFSPFIVDATVTILRRLVAGERIWQAHRKHYYQRMVRIGWGHARVALAEYCVMATVALASLVAIRVDAAAQAAFLAALAVGYAAWGVYFDRRWSRHEAAESGAATRA
jgi:UDP-N-acetylmuramyl pentapeptide phosphotransferase/UDP-N-acetylglucosamine-1-phosphate transferase